MTKGVVESEDGKEVLKLSSHSKISALIAIYPSSSISLEQKTLLQTQVLGNDQSDIA
jgi:hypothetical protein